MDPVLNIGDVCIVIRYNACNFIIVKKLYDDDYNEEHGGFREQRFELNIKEMRKQKLNKIYFENQN